MPASTWPSWPERGVVSVGNELEAAPDLCSLARDLERQPRADFKIV